MLRTILFKFILAVWFIIWSPLLIIGLVSQKLSHIFVVAISSGILRILKIFANIKYQVHYPLIEENGIPVQRNENNRLDGKAIIAAKHMSILEIAVLLKHVPNSFFIIKRELMWLPVYGWTFWRMGLQPVNRATGATNIKKLTKAVSEKILDKKRLIIFPEGTRAKPGQKIKLKRGVFFISKFLKLPILPVGTDAGLYWPKRGKLKPGTANVYFEPMLPCNADLDEISKAINRHSA